ncbi:MAG: sigma-70 family RNA polymerase sigma factor [Myxococcota bacterium]
MAEELELLDRWRRGDDGAGNRLVRRHFHVVFRFLSNKVGDEATDLTQQTFLALVERRDRLDPAIGLRAYVLGVARHMLLRHLRGRYRDRAVFSPERVSAFESPPDLGTSPTRRIAQGQDRVLLDRALRSLPIDHQIALELHYWHELGIAQIATVLECSPSSVKSRLFRARHGLRRQVERLSTRPSPLLERLEDELSSLRSFSGG